MKNEKIKLTELQTLFASNSERGDSERLELLNTLLPDIEKAIKKIVESHDKNGEGKYFHIS